MSIKDLAEMIDIAFGISLTLGGLLWAWLYFKVEKIHDELKELRKNKEEVTYGHWKPDGTCSVCGKHTLQSYGNFCCYCGSDMKGESE